MLSDFVIVLTTFPVDRDADAFARVLVGERLAACANVLPPMRSIYTWKGAVEAAEERQIVIKTAAARIRDLEKRVKELHPYEVPEFVVVPITEGSAAYLAWIADNVNVG